MILEVVPIPIDTGPCTLVPAALETKLVIVIGTGQVILPLWGMGTGRGEKKGEIETGARSKKKVRSIHRYMGKCLVSSRDNWAKPDDIGTI